MITRRTFHLSIVSGAAAAIRAAEQPVRLIAHRGGIVGDEFAENSPASVEAAIKRGYWMIEVDIRRTKDGRAIIQHDSTFERFYGDPRRVSEMTWDEIRELRATPGGSRPILFDEAVELCSGRIRIMLDIKESAAPPEFYRSIVDSLRAHQTTPPTYSLGGSGPLGPMLMENGVRVSASAERLGEAARRGEDVVDRHFLFELGSRIDANAVALARDHNVDVVAALNTFRYEQAGVDHHEGAKADARRLLSMGVRAFQIDSIYDQYFPA